MVESSIYGEHQGAATVLLLWSRTATRVQWLCGLLLASLVPICLAPIASVSLEPVAKAFSHRLQNGQR